MLGARPQAGPCSHWLVESADVDQAAITDLVLEQTSGTGQNPDLGEAVHVQGRIRLGVSGKRRRRGAAVGGPQRMVSGVDRQPEVGQEDEQQPREHSWFGHLAAKSTHLIDILCPLSGEKQEARLAPAHLLVDP